MIVVLGLVFFHGWRPIRPRSPYTVVRTETVRDQSGAPVSIEYVEALRTDGATMWKAAAPTLLQRRIYLANGDKILVNESLARKSTYPRSTHGEALVRVPESSCLTDSEKKLGWRVEGSERIAVYRTVRLVYQGPNHFIRSWHALDVGCATVQQSFEDATGRSVQTLASLTMGEPDPALFHVPVTVREVPPSWQYSAFPLTRQKMPPPTW